MTGMRPLQGWFSVFLADAYLRDGRPGEAAALGEQALEITSAAHFQYGAGLARQALGRIARAQGEHSGAEEHLREAIESFGALEVPFEVARTRLDLALLAHARGDVPETAAQLAEAHRAFVELRVLAYAGKALHLARALAVELVPAS